MQGRNIKLYGIAAPLRSQTCANGRGRGYRCGQEALFWLSEWLADNSVECHILGQTQKGTLIGICLLGAYDIGAALVNAGWAVADTRKTKIYEPYQKQALKNKRGLWQGSFYMPWDWQKIQQRRPKKRRTTLGLERSSEKDFWSDLFGG